MTKRGSKNTPYIITIFFNILLFIVVIILMNYVQQLLRSDVHINLAEIVTQNKDVINSKIMLEVNNLNMVSKQISERISIANNASDDSVEEIFTDYVERIDDPMLIWSNKEGKALYGTGEQVNIAGRKYFQLAMQGKANISERTISRLNGDDIFVISVPLTYNSQTIGTIQKQYTPKEMYEICSVSLFSQQGYMYIINSDGYILISSRQNQYDNEASNYYRMVHLSNPNDAKQLEQNIHDKKAGFMELTLEGEQIFSAYTPIEQVHDWYLITSINTDAVMPNATIVVKMFYAILFVVVVSFGASMFYHLFLKNKQQLKLEKVAFIDEVTGGNTYTKFSVDVQNIFLNKPNDLYYIVAFDIDSFRYINRFNGFETGDKILTEVYGYCSKQLLPHEFIARSSADHFLILLTDISETRIHTMFCSELLVNGIKIYLSAGIYPVKDTTESLNLMVDKANLASQQAKGKRFKEVEFYSKKFDEELAHNEQIKRNIEQALLDDEIIPFFQPKININDNSLSGAEALARWITKEGKMISPAEFIPVCEEAGIISLIDWRIFDKTLQFIRSNLDKGVQCKPISVNFSRTNLLNVNFINMLHEKLLKYNVPGNLVEVELTETLIFDNSESINIFIEHLHEIGITVSMDDFGLGYSSLHMLKDVDIDVLKIDKAFLQASANSDKQKVVFETIIQMAKKLNIKTVVEGVETIENVDLMRDVDCCIAQGFYYSRPINPDLFSKIYEDGKI